jgi:hypothetical protein
VPPPVVGSHDPNPNQPPRVPNRVRHDMLHLPDQTPFKTEPGGPSLASSGEPPPWEPSSGGQRRRSERSPALGRGIQGGRSRLDRALGGAEPPDRDPSVQIQGYRFGVRWSQSRPIQDLRWGLDLFKFGCRPLDPDPAAVMRAYPFAVEI